MNVLCFIGLISLPALSPFFWVIQGKPLHQASEADFLFLHNRILHNYSRYMRPITNQSEAIDVSLDFSLLSIFDVDDVKQQISVMAMITVQWVDKNLVWKPEEYGGINRMFLKQQQIWTPEVYVESGHNSVTLFSLPTQHVVRSTGTVVFTSLGNVESPCSLDLTIFPYDKQTCKFGFGVLDSTVKEVNLTFGSQGVTKSKRFVEDGEWIVDGTGSDIVFPENGDELYMTAYAIVKIKRRSTYYIINIIIPSAAMAVLSLLTFGVPVESGERLAYALTILLSLSVYITYIGNIMPMSSVNMPIIFYLLLGLYLVSSMCVIMTVLVIAIRWSHVIGVTEQEKVILLFGVSVRIKRKPLRYDPAIRCCPWRLRSYKNDSKSSQNSSTSSQDQQEFHESKDMKVHSLEDRSSRHTSSGSSLSYQFDPDTDNKRRLPEDRQSEPSSGTWDHSGSDQTSDPDIMFICNRLNLYSFIVLLLVVVLLFSFSFVQFYHQILPE